MLNYSLTQNQKLNLSLSDKMLQSIHVLQISAMDLEDFLLQKANDNPFLEIVWNRKRNLPRKIKSSRDSEKRGDLIESLQSESETLESMIINQLRVNNVPKDYIKASEFLAGNLNDNGYLEISLEEAARILNVSLETVRKALDYVQACEPAGVGATSLSECLQLQIIRHSTKAAPYSYEIVSKYLEELAKGKIKILAQKLGASQEEVEIAVRYIRSLNPRPGLVVGKIAKNYIEADAAIVNENGKFIVLINEDLIPTVQLNSSYQLFDIKNKEIHGYIREQIRSVYWLKHCLEQRKKTLQRVVEKIVEKQIPFLKSGIEQLKPLNMKAIAKELDLHESTVSRAVQNKYVQTPRGIFELKFFFANGVATMEGTLACSDSVKEKIKHLIETEDKSNPLSDQKIKELLEQSGLKISRRTVMKYREELQILSSRYRGRKP